MACVFTDEQLREDLAAGLRPVEIAAKYGVSRAAVSKRVNRIGLTTVAATHAPEESRRYAGATIDAMAELGRWLAGVNLLVDACQRWLAEVDEEGRETGRMDVGPRADEVMVTYLVPSADQRKPPERRRRPLSYLLALVDDHEFAGQVQRSETQYADPRQLFISAVAEGRKQIDTAASLARMLADARVMEQFRTAVLAEIAKESPEVASRIASAVRRSLTICEAFRGPDALPG